MGEYVDRTLERVPPGFTLAAPLVALFAWVEREGRVTRTSDGELHGALSGDPVGTDVALRGFRPEEAVDYTASWFDHDGAHASLPRLWPFCKTGADGSMAALWDDGGRMRIVHLGSGSGSMLTCVLADDAVDFLRLLAVGYEELCWQEDWSAPPSRQNPFDEGWQPENPPFRAWVTDTFGVAVPRTAAEIVPHAPDMGDEDTTDDWCRLVNGFSGRG